MPVDHIIDELVLQSGLQTRGLRLRYEMHGSLNATRSNAILVPTWFGTRHPDNCWIVGSGRALDTDKYCVLLVNTFGNGESASPSNDPQLVRGGEPEAISIYDNVRAQAQLIDSLGIQKLFAVVGRSTAAQQALQWASLCPHMVERIVVIAGQPRTSEHTKSLLNAMESALVAGRDGRPDGVANAAKIFADVFVSPEYDSDLGAHRSADQLQWIENHVVLPFQEVAAQDLLCQVRAWKTGDISNNPIHRGDLTGALGYIRARTLLLPISHDLLVPPREVESVRGTVTTATVQRLFSTWGHAAATPDGSEVDIGSLETIMKAFLEDRRQATPGTLDRLCRALSF